MTTLGAVNLAEKILTRTKEKEIRYHEANPTKPPIEYKPFPTVETAELPEGNHQLQAIEPCAACTDKFLMAEGQEGTIIATTCTVCVPFNSNSWAVDAKIHAIGAAEVPNRYFKALTRENIRPEILEVAESLISQQNKNPFLFFHGGIGTGKTHSAAHIMLNYLQKTNLSCFYIPVYEYLELNRNRSAYGFEHGKLRSNTQHAFKHVRDRSKNVDLLILDELGQEVLTTDQQKSVFDLLDSRYRSNKPTILISNHCENKAISLDGKILSELIGSRIASRIKSAKLVYFSGEDYRVTKEHSEVITEEEAEKFKMNEKILTHSDDEHQIMTWVTRISAFKTVSTQERKDLTYIYNGEERDSDRREPSIYEDIWVKGDSLIIHGPICDQEDEKLYCWLVKELTNQHTKGHLGLTINLSFRYILQGLGLSSSSGENIKRVRRQLDRLNRMSLSFSNAKGHKWSGPLITDLEQFGQSSDQKLKISFSRCMIPFYRLNAYTTFDRITARKLKGDSATLYFFYISHSESRPITLNHFKGLLALSDEIDHKETMRRAKKMLDNLIKASVLDPKESFIKGGKIFTQLLCPMPQ